MSDHGSDGLLPHRLHGFVTIFGVQRLTTARFGAQAPEQELLAVVVCSSGRMRGADRCAGASGGDAQRVRTLCELLHFVAVFAGCDPP